MDTWNLNDMFMETLKGKDHFGDLELDQSIHLKRS
jgi:hypothetical protein